MKDNQMHRMKREFVQPLDPLQPSLSAICMPPPPGAAKAPRKASLWANPWLDHIRRSGGESSKSGKLPNNVISLRICRCVKVNPKAKRWYYW